MVKQIPTQEPNTNESLVVAYIFFAKRRKLSLFFLEDPSLFFT